MKNLKIAILIAAINSFVSCVNESNITHNMESDTTLSNNIETHTIKESNLFESQRFTEYISKLDDTKKKEEKKRYERIFHNIGQDSFLYAYNYDFYAVFLYNETEVNDSFHFYTIRSKKGKVQIDLLSVPDFKDVSKPDKNPAIQNQNPKYQHSQFTKVPAGEIKRTLNAAVIRYNMEGTFSGKSIDPLRGLWYYDGKKYHMVSNMEIDSQGINMIDSLFRQSDIFKK